MTRIPVYTMGKIVELVHFTENLNLRGPRYLNESANMGLARTEEGKLVLMYQHEEFPSSDKAEYISEEEAYTICLNRGKQHLIEKLQIQPIFKEGEIE